MKVFSFCLYGTNRLYYSGLLQNIASIREYFPDFSIYVYRGVCDPTWTLDGVHVVDTGLPGPINTLHRLLPLTFADIGFCRDADSRMTERDRWCISEFLKSDKSYHIIRDHFYHKSPIMAGMFGWKKALPISIQPPTQATYGIDEAFLQTTVYPLVIKDALVHTNISAFVGEETTRIEIPQNDPADFVGNVILADGTPQFTYTFDVCSQLSFLRSQDQFGIIRHIVATLDPLSIPYDQRMTVYDIAYTAQYYTGHLEDAQYWLRQFEFADVTPHIYSNAKYLFRALGKRIVASFDPSREPGEGDLVIVYGNYPDGHLALPGTNKLFRHVSLFFELDHDIVEYHPAWEPIDTVYILNLRERTDRWYETLLTLASVGAPLHRVHHYIADKSKDPYIGATQNHVDVMAHFCASGKSHALVLEDDFVFIDDKQRVLSSLQDLFTNPRPYDLCFLSISKVGERLPHDELLSRSKQPCTTSSGYLLQRSTAPRVYEMASEGVRKMSETGNHHDYCIDRYWSRLPEIFFFKTKLGFQRPCYSNLRATVVAHLD